MSILKSALIKVELSKLNRVLTVLEPPALPVLTVSASDVLTVSHMEKPVWVQNFDISVKNVLI